MYCSLISLTVISFVLFTQSTLPSISTHAIITVAIQFHNMATAIEYKMHTKPYCDALATALMITKLKSGL